jgi:hypothetical protein
MRESSNLKKAVHYLMHFLFASFFIFHCQNVKAQWNELYGTSGGDTNSSIAPIFAPGNCSLGVGLGAVWHDDFYHFYRGGEVVFPFRGLILQYTASRVVCFTFKNAAMWWLLTSGAVPQILQSQDSGNSWSIIGSGPNLSSISYNTASGRLLGASSTGLYYSLDEGLTWNLQLTEGHYTFAFSTPEIGVTSGSSNEPLAYTTDGGVTWKHSNLLGVQYQPLGIPSSSTFFAVSDQGPTSNTLSRSDDGGATWRSIYQFPVMDTMTGAVTGTLCRLYVQTSQEVLVSTDEGQSWRSIGGPGNDSNSAMWSDGHFVFASTSMVRYGGNLSFSLVYEHVEPKARLTILPARYSDTSCESKDISFNYFLRGDCPNSIVKALGLTGSSAFQLIRSSALPDTLVADDSVRVRFVPVPNHADTAYLLMSVCTPDGTIDTSITLIGHGLPPPPVVRLTPVLSQPTAHAGDILALTISPNIPINDLGLNSIDFDLSFYDDLLDILSIRTQIPGAILISPTGTRTGVKRTLPIHISGTNLSLDPSTPVLSISLRAMLTDSNTTPITLSNLSLNGGDPSYHCVLEANLASTNFELSQACGDTTIQHILRKGQLTIESLTPNPTHNTLRVTLTAKSDEPIEVTIFDVLGNPVQQTTQLAPTGTIDWNTRSLMQGSYVLRLHTSIGTVSRRFVKVE